MRCLRHSLAVSSSSTAISVSCRLAIPYSILYNIVMDRLSDIFSSRTRTEVLSILVEQSEPIHLRALAELSTVAIRAIQEAVEDLVRERLVRRSKQGRRVCFALNQGHPDYPLICAIVRTANEHFLEQRARSYGEHAQSALDFASDAHELFSEVRRLNQ